MSDLLKSVKEETEIDISLIKINAIALIGLILSLGFSIFLNRLFQASGSIGFNITFTLILGILFLVMIFLQSILVKDIKRVATILFLQALALLAPFIFVLNGFILVGFIITYLMLFWGSASCKKELQYSMKIRIFRVSKFILPKAITGLTIFVVASYLGAFQSTQLKISPETFKRLVLPVDSLVKIILPGFAIEDNFSNMVINLNKLQDKPKSEQLGIVEQQQKYFSDLMHYKFEANESIINILYNAYSENIGSISDNSKILILFVIGLVLFLLIRSIGTPISWFVALISSIIYEILLTLGFATVVLETRSREIILLK